MSIEKKDVYALFASRGVKQENCSKSVQLENWLHYDRSAGTIADEPCVLNETFANRKLYFSLQITS